MVYAVSLKGVEKQYTKGKELVPVLAGINLDIEAGDFLALMGPSGSGKTTLLNLIGGLDYPTGGEIEVGGQSLNNMKAKALARWRSENIGFIFQFYNLIPSLTAHENVACLNWVFFKLGFQKYQGFSEGRFLKCFF